MPTTSPKLERCTPSVAKLSSQSCDSFGTFSQSNSSFLFSNQYSRAGGHTNINCGEESNDAKASRDLEAWVKQQAARISEEQEREDGEEEEEETMTGIAEWTKRKRNQKIVTKKVVVLKEVDVGEVSAEDLEYNDAGHNNWPGNEERKNEHKAQQAKITSKPLGNSVNFFYSKSHHQFSNVRDDFRDLYVRRGVKRMGKPSRRDGIGAQLEKFTVWGGLSHIRRHPSPKPMLPDGSEIAKSIEDTDRAHERRGYNCKTEMATSMNASIPTLRALPLVHRPIEFPRSPPPKPKAVTFFTSGTPVPVETPTTEKQTIKKPTIWKPQTYKDFFLPQIKHPKGYDGSPEHTYVNGFLRKPSVPFL